MNISFVSTKGTPVNIFSDLAKALSKRISGLELEQRFVPFPEDLPGVALECAKNSDFVFVFALLEDEETVRFVKEKLVEVELLSRTRILKAVEVDDFSGTKEEDFAAKKEELVEKYVDLVVAVLFNESEFEPKDPKFGA
jgi:hypothetical protein